MTRPRKVGFVLLSPADNPIPSTRISVLNMLPFLCRAGYDPTVVFQPPAATEVPDLGDLADRVLAGGFDVAYFQKVHGPSVQATIARVASAGVRTVYGVCDRIDPDLVRATDHTVAVAQFLKDMHPAELHNKISVVHDGIEQPSRVRAPDDPRRGTRAHPLRCVLVTSSSLDAIPAIGRLPPWATFTIVGRYPPLAAQASFASRARVMLGQHRSLAAKARTLRLLVHPRVQLAAWDPERVYREMQTADVGILPVDRIPPAQAGMPPPAWQLKSENRLTMKMCIGLPVIATPIPSYLPVVAHGTNAFFADTESDWASALERLRDPATRAAMGGAARASVSVRYSREEQAARLIAVLDALF